MARKPMVTRTIVTTKAILMCVDTELGEVFNTSVVLPRTYKDEKAIIKACENVDLGRNSAKVVSVVSSEEVETMYGMDEQKFIENAVVLNPETRKILEAETETNVAE